MPDAATYAARLERLRAELGRRGVDGLLVSQPESRFYLSGYTGHDQPPRDSAGYLLIGRTEALLLTDLRTTEQAGQETSYEVVAYPTRSLAPASVAERARRLGIGRLAFEAIHLPYATWRSLAAEMPEVEMVGLDDVVDRLRVTKDPAELAALQAAVDVLDRCFEHLIGWIEPGMTERQVAREVEQYLIEHADGPSFPSIVASGPNGSMPHAVPTDRAIREGEGVTIDIGARVAGYCSDMTRTICLGEPADPKLRDVHAVVLAAQEAAEAGIRPGMTGREGDSIARDVLAKACYAEAFTHSLGHGIGLEVHEPPWLSRVQGDETLEPGMVFSVEPGVYLPGWGGVRIEDLVVMEPSGPRVMCRSPKNLTLSR